MNYKINNRFSLSSDSYNWILVETITTPLGKKYTKNRYFGTLKQVSGELINLMAKDTLSRHSHNLNKKTPSAKPYNFLMDNIVNDLELFLKGVVANGKK
jgi:hypothetical protein